MFFSLLLSLVLAATQPAHADQWKRLGHRWAGELDNQGNVTGIYDLSYPDLLSRFPLGLLGNTSKDKAQLSTLSLGPTKATTQTRLPQDWWKKISWRTVRSMNNEEPTYFRLSDINMTTSRNDKLAAAIQRAEKALNQLEGNGMGTSFMNGFEFEKVGEGSYQMYWTPQTSRAASVSAPRKLADLTSPKSEFLKAMEWELAKVALSQAFDLLPWDIVSALADTATDRLFHFMDLVANTQRNMFLEALNSSLDGTGTLSNLDLTASEKQSAVEALSFAETSLFDSWKWIWNQPYTEWLSAVQSDEGIEKDSLNWMNQNGVRFNPVNARFAYSDDPAQQLSELVLLARSEPSGDSGPVAAIDYSNPNKNFNDRILLEASTMAVDFGSHFIPIPILGSVAKAAYKYFVERPVDTTKIWEGRLTVQLEEQGEQKYMSDLTILDHQRVNPLYQSRQDMDKLIIQRAQQLGLP